MVKKKVNRKICDLMSFLKDIMEVDEYILFYTSPPLITEPMVKFDCTSDFKEKVKAILCEKRKKE